MTETVPADIAAAIDHLSRLSAAFGQARPPDKLAVAKAYDNARTDLDAVILHNLRAYAEMKAALERIEQGA